MKTNLELDYETGLLSIYAVAHGDSGFAVAVAQVAEASTRFGLARFFTDATFRLAIADELIRRQWMIWAEGRKAVALTEAGRDAAKALAAEPLGANAAPVPASA